MRLYLRRGGRSRGDRGRHRITWSASSSTLGIDCIGDGEFWKARNFIYYSRHFTGIETTAAQARRDRLDADQHARARRIRAVLPGFRHRRDDLLRARREADAARARMHGRDAARSSRKAPRRSRRRSTTFKAAARQGRAGGRRGVLLRDRAGLARSLHLQRILQDRRGIHLRARRGVARGIPRDRRRRLHPADRRSRPGGLVGHAQAGAERRGLSQQIRQAAHRCASTTRSRAFRKTACATTCAGAPGTGRTPTICRSSTSST